MAWHTSGSWRGLRCWTRSLRGPAPSGGAHPTSGKFYLHTGLRKEQLAALPESSVDSLNQEVLTLKEKENTREQAERGNTTRLFGLSMGQDEGTGPDFGPALAKRVYDSIIKPVLASAKLNKHLETLPTLPNAIREVYRIKPSNKLPTGNQSPPPPVIIKFASSAVKSAFFRNKRASLPTPSADEKAGSSAVGDTTTTCTSEDDVTHYHAYTQTGSDSESLSVSR